ncbi:TonB-dependent siderophore receptor [Sphingomonas morindae]|uniref:TonB-dependent receptor n=1 Tax=Sphingomonas morindae TaxID=1541170 RepID=A0ABY4X6B1_9SPHN|nr:TonB-dependent receptor [Sphingomonas morindae]USI72448.1 TonB-dependent receptor [Sphingomonas morindae]
MTGGIRFLACSLIALSTAAAAQQAAPKTDESKAPAQDAPQDIVVTAVSRGQNLLKSAVSVSSLSADAIAQSAPRSTAELFRNIPGIRAEASGGEGNANISVRGLPVASGGAKFLQLQEDGLPVLEFGDITFGNADIFLRADTNIARIEAVRGGSASTFASNSPGGVINFLSKTGETQGGAVQAGIGLNYGEYRFDGDYGGKLSETVRFHVGGFYRQGEGPRRAGYDGNKGGQIKANITKEFTGGYLRLYGKYLNDRAIAYMPNPVRVTGTDADPHYTDLPGFSITQDTLHSRYDTRNVTLDGDNRPATHDLRDGQHPLVKAVGLEGKLDLGAGWTATERFRYADISGRFITNFPSAVDRADATAVALGGAGATARYFNGPQAGQAVPGDAYLARVVVFDVSLNSLNNITNDFRLNRSFQLGGGALDVTLGFYKSRQTINTDWLWTSTLLAVQGGGRAALVDVRNAAGTPVTENGYYAYSATYFGDCCRRSYRLHYNVNAPFASFSWNLNALTLDASLRYDFGNARGRIAGADLGGGRVGVQSFDINGDGTISAPETRVAVLPLGSAAPVHYNYDYLSYSFGVNYRLRDDLSVFGRYSRGARANADRLLFGPAVRTSDGGLADSSAAVDFVTQAEGGVKYRAGGIALYATGFYARTEEQNYEATQQRFLDRKYRSYGVELEGNVKRGIFQLSAGGTWTNAKITADPLTPAVVGNKPRRQADFTYQLAPELSWERVSLGASIVGTTDSYTQDANKLKLPGYTTVNAFVQVRPLERVQLSINANNLFDVKGFTEAEDATIPANGIVRARSINGRTVAAAVRLQF